MKRFPPYPSKPHRSGQARITVKGKAYYLGPHGSDESWAAYQQLLEEWRAGDVAGRARPQLHAGSITVADLVAQFMEWTTLHQSAGTSYGYRFYANSLADAAGTLLVERLKPFHVTRWIDAKKKAGRWGDVAAYNARRTAFRVCNWAKEEGLIEKNPLAGMKRPRPEGRRRVLSAAEFAVILRNTNIRFRQLAFALRHTGARPKELRQLTWGQVRSDRIVISDHKTRATLRVKRDRVIWLTPIMMRLMAFMERQQVGHQAGDNVFVNTKGRPWTNYAVSLALQAIRRRSDLAKDACLYLLRHSWGTAAIINGTNPAVVAELMGNSVEVVVGTYVHLAEQHEHLAAEVAKATAGVHARQRPITPTTPTTKKAG